MQDDWQAATKAIHQRMARTTYGENSPALFLTSGFAFDSAEHIASAFRGEGEQAIYSRYNNPTVDELIGKACALEGMEAGFATGTGMGAVFASMAALVGQGDHIIATRDLFGSTHQLLTNVFPKWGVDYTYVAPDDPRTWEAALRPNTKLFVTETPSNPGLKLVDLTAAGAFCRAAGLTFIVDNCFATPVLQRPGEFGAHIVTTSATKWMDGQGRVLGGLILGSEALMEKVVSFCRHTGPVMSPFNAWLISKSLETLSVRMEAHCRSALTLARWLEAQPTVKRVLYPHLPSHPQYELAKQQMAFGGGMVTFELEGGEAAAHRLLDAVRLCQRVSNLGDTRTILTHPRTTTHSKLTEEERQEVGITGGMVRMSVGLEAVVDIRADLEGGLF